MNKLGIEKIADESTLDMEKSAATTSKNLRAILASIQQHMSSDAPAIKATLTKLKARTERALTKIDEAEASAKDQRERVLSESYAKKGLLGDRGPRRNPRSAFQPLEPQALRHAP